MAGIYIHIPFCRQACHYCDFHFSTSSTGIPPVMAAIKSELHSRIAEMEGEVIETIYFGGGTPSLMETDYIREILDIIFSQYNVAGNPEITLEANPDDLTREKLRDLRNTPVNRFSIGIQSFSDQDLSYMNRAHTSAQADYSIKAAQDCGFTNISIDLIYGTPGMHDAQWQENLMKAVELSVPHISSYALTVENETPLFHFIRREILPAVNEEDMERQFGMLMSLLPAAGFEAYEISNFAQPGFRSKHNSSYWQGKPYLGIGPSAHSFDGNRQRRWNVAHNIHYSRKLQAGETYWEIEELTEKDRVNEFLMIRLRTIEGIPITLLTENFGNDVSAKLLASLEAVPREWYEIADNYIRLTLAGKLFADRTAALLFITED